ncbi:MAG: hypothetical protein HFE78_00380 [Clostridiales bacterium]|nr:hypothetical protein [Clostridiales bacterium]
MIKDEAGIETTYKLVESVGSYGKTIYSIFVLTNRDMSYLEEVGTDLHHATNMFEKICRSLVRPEFFFDLAEELI